MIYLHILNNREKTWVAKGIDAWLYFRVSTPPSSKYITEVGLAFEEILPQIGLLTHTEFYLLHFFISRNPVPTIFLIILYSKKVSIYHKYCTALSSVCFRLFPHFSPYPSLFLIPPTPLLFSIPLLLSPPPSPPLSVSPPNLLLPSSSSSSSLCPPPLPLSLGIWLLIIMQYVANYKFWAGEWYAQGCKLKQVYLEPGGWTRELLEDECWRLGSELWATVGLN